MEMSEFLEREPEAEAEATVEESEELDIQKAVVESLAADKAEQDERISQLQKENSRLRGEISELKLKLEALHQEFDDLGQALVRNSEGPESNKVALLDRDIEISDRYEGETRDHVLEVLKLACEQAEKDGRCRRAQILESVLMANESSGNLAKKREKLEKIFTENANIVSGPVIEFLNKEGIAYKHGEDYLLPSEIIKRVY